MCCQGELQADELADLRATFEACDSDMSGGMDLGELTTVLKLWGVGRSTSIGRETAEDPGTVAAELIMSAKQGYAKMGGSTKSEFQALVDSIGMPWGIADPDVEDMELSFPEFMHLMVSGVSFQSVQPCDMQRDADTILLLCAGRGEAGERLERGRVPHASFQEWMYEAPPVA